MKRQLILIALIVFSIMVVNAQGGGGRNSHHRQELQNLKIAFMTENLSLTPSESEKFWPLYNKYWEDRVALTAEKRKLYSKIDTQPATQADLSALLKIATDETALMSKFASDISRVLSLDKAAKTFVIEEKFKSTLLRRSQSK